MPAKRLAKAGSSHRVTVKPKAISVFFSARDILPWAAFCSRMYSSTPSSWRISGLLSRNMIRARTTNMARQMGKAMAIHWAKEMRVPVASSIRPRPIRFGGEPTGVSNPPTDAP